MIRWYAEEERATPRMVLSMLKDLPQHARLHATRFDPELLQTEEEKESGEAPPASPEDFDWFEERRIWDRPEMQMAALQANLLRQLVIYVPNWIEGKSPDWSPVGPPEWRHPELTQKPKQPTVVDIMQVFGYQGPGEGHIQDTHQAPQPSIEDVAGVFGF